MGSGITSQTNSFGNPLHNDTHNSKFNDHQLNTREKYQKQKDYDIQVIEVSNIALAIRNKQHTINVQLSLRCQYLPAVKAFGSIDSMVVIFKKEQQDFSKQSNSASLNKSDKASLIEIGRTQVINNNINPKFIKTFILPFNQEKNEELQFRVYHIKKNTSQQLSQQELVGIAVSKLGDLVDIQNNDLQIQPVQAFENNKNNNKHLSNKFTANNLASTKRYNSKSFLKINCTQYQGGTSKYQIGIQLSNFLVGRSEVYYVIQACKFGQWFPVARSETRKPSKFKQLQVNINKFQGQDNSGIRIKIYESEKQQEIGSTNQFSISDINSDQKMQNHRVYNGGFVVGNLYIYKWKKRIRDSFISYIVGGAKLHLILAVDFTNSNGGQLSKNCQSLHKLNQNGENTYTKAIRQIVGVLQYFSLQNQVAFYGFGAKLPPYYRSISQCFAMNGNYFNPNVEGGVEELLKLYKQNLKKIKMHGPTKISQILNLAIKYANQQQSISNKSHSYYVLIIITDGKLNDYDDAVQLIIKASSYPLSILFVGVSNQEQNLSLKRDSSNQKNLFSALESLDSDTGSLKSQKTGKVCQRDIVDFIRINDFLHDQSKLTLARQTFAQIPDHFIEYMSRKGIKPLKQQKSLRAAKAEFISEKIKSSTQKTKPYIPSFLISEKKQMKKKLISLGFSSKDPILQKINISTNDLSYFIQIQSHIISQPSNQYLQRMKKYQKEHTEKIACCQIKKLQSYLHQRQSKNRQQTLQQLQKIESNQYGFRLKLPHKPPPTRPLTPKILEHPCLICYKQQIVMLHYECGHSSICEKCYQQDPKDRKRCIICFHINQKVKNVEKKVRRQEKYLNKKYGNTISKFSSSSSSSDSSISSE